MKLAGSVILYNPPDNVFNNIETYIEFVEHLYVFDNSPKYNNCIPELYEKKVSYIHSGENDGISKCLNKALNLSMNAGFEYLLTMDQDSSFNEGDLQVYINLIEKETKKMSISMYGIRYYPIKISEKLEKNYNQLLITSGSIINISISRILHGFDENLFIDGVDTEYCLKSYRNGYQTVLYNKFRLNHALGEEKRVITPLLQNKYRKFHNPSRLYYIVRNHFYLRRKYHEYHSFLKNIIVINEIKNSFLYGGNTLKNINALLLALKHSTINKLGKQNNYHGI
jgi:rhamnosyltransferase